MESALRQSADPQCWTRLQRTVRESAGATGEGLCVSWNEDASARAVAGRALDLDDGALANRPFAHRSEPKVTGKRGGRIEPDPVVG